MIVVGSSLNGVTSNLIALETDRVVKLVLYMLLQTLNFILQKADRLWSFWLEFMVP